MAKGTSKDVRTAENAESRVEAAQGQTPKKERKAGKESVYPVDDLAANARKIFGTRQECIAAALKAAGKSECTVSEARGIVERFLKREVK